MQITVQSVLLFSAFVLIWRGLFSSPFGAHASGTAAPVARSAIASMAMISLVVVLIATLSLLFVVPPRTTASIAAGSLAVIAGIALSLGSARKLLRGTRSRGANVRHFVIIGTNARAVSLARRIEADLDLGYRLVGSWTSIGRERRCSASPATRSSATSQAFGIFSRITWWTRS